MNSFNRYIKKYPNELPIMPLCHTCDGFAFMHATTNNTISIAPCDKYPGESLAYVYYGRPAYRSDKMKKGASKMPMHFPTCFVLKPEAITNIKRILPFDSGAFKTNLFDNYFHPRHTCEDFQLEPTLDMPGRLVHLYYGSNKQYYHGQPEPKTIPETEFEIKAYCELIRETAVSELDDRASSIELQSDISINLSKDNVLLVILPVVFMDDQNIKETIINNWGASIRTYSAHRSRPNEYIALFYEIISEYLLKEKYL